MMKFQHQTVLGAKGNCWSTCVAILLGVDTTKVPNFCDLYPLGWRDETNAWLGTRFGAKLVEVTADATMGATYYIATGPGPRDVPHAVIMQDDNLAWDPHPDDLGLLRVEKRAVLAIQHADVFVQGYAELSKTTRRPSARASCKFCFMGATVFRNGMGTCVRHADRIPEAPEYVVYEAGYSYVTHYIVAVGRVACGRGDAETASAELAKVNCQNCLRIERSRTR